MKSISTFEKGLAGHRAADVSLLENALFKAEYVLSYNNKFVDKDIDPKGHD